MLSIKAKGVCLTVFSDLSNVHYYCMALINNFVASKFTAQKC